MELRPRKNTLLIQPEEKKKERKVGSIILPEHQWSMHPDVQIGTILKTGDDCVELKKGMKVVVSRFAGVDVVPEEGSPKLIAEEDVIAEVLND